MNRLVALILFISATVIVPAQNKTISKDEKPQREASAAHKVMLVPFEPKLYLSEVDHRINAETHLTPREIRNTFRDGLNEQLYKAFRQNKYGAVDLMEDTVKYRKDIEGIYQYIAYDYLKVPDQQNYKAPAKEKDTKKIDKGQLSVETNSDKRFMHTRVTDPRLVPMLYGRYKTDIFVFVNQLDIRASGSPDMLNHLAPARKIVVHYTVYSKDARELNSGIAEEEFDAELNNPRKIIDRHFSRVAATIVERVTKSLAPPVAR